MDLTWEAYNVVVAPRGLPEDVERDLTEVFDAAVTSVEFADAAARLGLVINGADGETAKNRLSLKSEEAASLLSPSK